MNRKHNLSNLKELLKHGDVTEAAKEAKVSTMTIYNVLNGKHQNDKVYEVLIKIIGRNQAKRNAVVESLLNAMQVTVNL